MALVMNVVIVLVSLVPYVTLLSLNPIQLQSDDIEIPILRTNCSNYKTVALTQSQMLGEWKGVKTTAPIQCATIAFSKLVGALQPLEDFLPGTFPTTKVKAAFLFDQLPLGGDFLMLPVPSFQGRFQIKQVPNIESVLEKTELQQLLTDTAVTFELAVLKVWPDTLCLYICTLVDALWNTPALYIFTKDGASSAANVQACISHAQSIRVPLANLTDINSSNNCKQ